MPNPHASRHDSQGVLPCDDEGHRGTDQATRTFKKTFGYHPIGVWCDNTGEMLAASLRPGNAGSNTTADHIEVLSAAIPKSPPGTPRSC